ncbi:Protein T04B2.3 b [Aphelenchoides avenae]|nr:Protein T04B2.3 b [Aphelenchus avenae]
MEEQGRGSVADKSEKSGYRGSCPDLSDDQLKIWDEILHNAVTAEKQMNEMLVQTMKQADSSNKLASHTEVNGTSNGKHYDNAESASAQGDKIMRTSIYELCPPHVFDALDAAVHADGISNRELRTLDKKLNDISLEESFTTETMVDRLRQLHERSSSQETNPAQIHRSLQQELEDLHFKPDASDRSYPPVSSGSQFHMTTYNPQNRSVKNEIYQTIKKEDLPHLQEDYFEGMHIRVNAFEDIDDLALSESECPPPSRFQQLQWALQRQKQKYVQVDNAPARVCCSIM